MVNGIKSDWAPVVSGVPQDTVLGPLLFSLYINDISVDIESKIRLFADDCVCYREIKNKEDTLKLQRDIDRLGSWARKWGMRFQPVKCNMMQLTNKRSSRIQANYTLEGTLLENVENIKYLGVTITNDFQRDIDRLGSWARKWGMRFQPVKCNMMQLTNIRSSRIQANYTLEGTLLENVESIKYLGVTITNDLKWNTHISNVCTKANITLGFLRRNLYSCPPDVKEAAYKGLVWPVLEY